MATLRYVGSAADVAQVDHVTPGGTIEAGDIFTITLENSAGEQSSVSFTATDTAVKTTCEGLVAAAVAAKTAGQDPWDEVTATEDDAKVIITAATAGVPFWATATTTNKGGGQDTQTLTRAASIAVSGPGIPEQANNWDSQTAPVDGDILVFGADCPTVIYGYDFGTTMQFLGLVIEKGCLAVFGSKAHPLFVDLKDDGSYYDATIEGCGSGSHIRIDNPNAVYIQDAPSTPGAGEYGLNLTGLHDAAKAVYIDCESPSASVGLAATSGEVLESDAITVSSGNVTIGRTVYENDGATAFALTVHGGTVESYSPLLSLTQYGGRTIVEEGACAALALYAGVCDYNSTGTLGGNTVVGGRGQLRFDQNSRPKTVTNPITVSDGGSVSDVRKTVASLVVDGNPDGLLLSWGANSRLTRAAIS